MAEGDFDPERMLRALDEAGVRFILIGGMAAILHGDVGVTIDVDIVPERSRENLGKLGAALHGLGPGLARSESPRVSASTARLRSSRTSPPTRSST